MFHLLFLFALVNKASVLIHFNTIPFDLNLLIFSLYNPDTTIYFFFLNLITHFWTSDKKEKFEKIQKVLKIEDNLNTIVTSSHNEDHSFNFRNDQMILYKHDKGTRKIIESVVIINNQNDFTQTCYFDCHLLFYFWVISNQKSQPKII